MSNDPILDYLLALQQTFGPKPWWHPKRWKQVWWRHFTREGRDSHLNCCGYCGGKRKHYDHCPYQGKVDQAAWYVH